MSSKANLEDIFFCIEVPTVFALDNIAEFCVNLPIWENLATKSTKVVRLGKFKKKSNKFSHFGKFIDKVNKICYNVNN